MGARKTAYEERYRIHAYVRHGAVHKRQSMLGRVTFPWVYQHRPEEYRYAVVSRWDVNTRSWRYEVLDLFEVLKDPMNKLTPPAPRWTHEDLSAAIMTTLLMYGSPA